MEQASAIRAAREAARMSQQHLADAAGVSKRTVIRAEQGARISDESLRCLCSVLGMEASDFGPETRRAPDTPLAALRRHVGLGGEDILWEGAPDAAGWRRDVRYRALLWAYGGLAAAAVGAAGLYAGALANHAGADGGPGPALWAAVAGISASLLMAWRAAVGVEGVRRTERRLRSTLLALTADALYTASLDRNAPAGIASVERVALPEGREGCRVRPRTLAWPLARSIRLPSRTHAGARTVHVEGLADLEAVARIMRGEPAAKAA